MLYGMSIGRFVDRRSNALVLPPLRRVAVFTPVLFQRADFVCVKTIKRRYVERDAVAGRPHPCNGYGRVSAVFDPLDFAAPASRVFAVDRDEFLGGESFVCVVPENACVRGKILFQCVCALRYDVLPESSDERIMIHVCHLDCVGSSLSRWKTIVCSLREILPTR